LELSQTSLDTKILNFQYHFPLLIDKIIVNKTSLKIKRKTLEKKKIDGFDVDKDKVAI
jgi:hypothetical protein